MEQINLGGRFTIILVVTAALVAALLGWGVRLGQDLRGGTTLRFSLDMERARLEDPTADPAKLVGATIDVIRDRIDKYGLSEVILTELGEDKFEIVLPAGSEGDIESLTRVVTSLGKLEFRIEVLPTERYGRWEKGRPPRLQQRASEPWQGTAEEFDEFKQKEVDAWKLARDNDSLYQSSDDRYKIVKKFGTEGAELIDFALLETLKDKDYDFNGQILQNPHMSKDERGKPSVAYEVKTEFQRVFAEWTSQNVGLPMSIVLNEEYRTAPIINSELRDNVQITLGARSTWTELEKEAEELTTVLRTGSLTVRPKLESVNMIGARLAGESKERGMLAVVVALLLVLLFMIMFYRMQGAVADLALLLNMVLLVGSLAFFGAVLTLPGIAGIVLTLGMAVDANILIIERIREERNAGRTLRRAVSEGYDRALTTIIDANVTSLITAIFLYVFGRGPVRGFAVTLGLGLLISMFTAIFVTRTVNEWLMKIGLFKELHIMGKGTPPKISWVALRRIFAPVSVLGVVAGLFLFGAEDKYTLYDVDFTGGIKLQARFQEPTTVEQVKDALQTEGVEIQVTRGVGDDGTRERRTIAAGPYGTAEVVAVGPAGEGVEITIQRGLLQEDLPNEEKKFLEEVQAEAFTEYVRHVLKDRLRPSWLMTKPHEYSAPEGASDELKDLDGGMAFSFTLVDSENVVTAEEIQKALTEDMPGWTWQGAQRTPRAASDLNRRAHVSAAGEPKGTLKTFDVTMKTTNPNSDLVIERDPSQLTETVREFLGGKGLRSSLERQGVAATSADLVGLSKPFPSVDEIGASVAAQLKNQALLALVLSLLGIIVYIALRFQSRAMGFAAVLCLFHDVTITLGIVAIANIFGVVDAKINLPMVAAFLTLVGYSVNDTVVVFDRIRENRGKKRVITGEMIDLSINQTLARTIKTSVTFLLATVALFAINYGQRNVLEGFSFLLIIGSVVGTYSTVAIAAPLLLYLPWLWERIKAFRPRVALVSYSATHLSTLLLTPIAVVVWMAWALVFLAVAFVVGLLLFPVWALGEKSDPLPAPAAA